jgi:hypothetical protein
MQNTKPCRRDGVLYRCSTGRRRVCFFLNSIDAFIPWLSLLLGKSGFDAFPWGGMALGVLFPFFLVGLYRLLLNRSREDLLPVGLVIYVRHSHPV